jgi:cell division protein ZapA
MAQVDIEIASRRYTLACRDGEEDHLRAVAEIVDKRARDAGEALGTLSETRQLLFASLLLADDLKDGSAGETAAAAEEDGLARALERLAERMESLADRLEQAASST